MATGKAAATGKSNTQNAVYKKTTTPDDRKKRDDLKSFKKGGSTKKGKC